MGHGTIRSAAWATLVALAITLLGGAPAPAQHLATLGQPVEAPPTHLTLEEAVQRALASNKSLHLAALVVEEKEHATRGTQAAYLPKVGALAVYTHMDNFLGSVITGPLGRTRSVALLNQDERVAALYVAQPLTPLLKVRQGVKIARADEQLAQVQVEKARRELRAGVEQL